jgi:two-component system cell cycle sensor histidine kinase/response regulator CckA
MYSQPMEQFEEATGWCMIEQTPVAETILLVEDDAFVRTVTCEVLQSAGYRVLMAENSAQAASIYEQRGGEVDLLLTDMILPGETGLALAASLRRQNSGLNILLVTGYATQKGLAELRPEELLAKPFSTQALLRRVRQLLGSPGLRTARHDSVTLACATA